MGLDRLNSGRLEMYSGEYDVECAEEVTTFQ